MICYGEPTARISATAQWMRLLPFGAVITARHAAFHGPAAITLFPTSTVRTSVRAATSFSQMIST